MILTEGGVFIDKVYFLHGFMGTGQTHFAKQLSAFKDMNVEAVDLPGHGYSTEKADKEYFKHALQWVISYIKERGEGYIIGLSLGASLAVHTALRSPESVKGIVLTGYSPEIPEEMTGAMEQQYHYFRNIEDRDDELVRHFKDLHGDKWKDTLEKVLYSMTYIYPSLSADEIRSIAVPALVLNGSEELHEAEAAANMKRQNTHIEVGLIPNAGHTANIDQPDIYNRLVREFIGRVHRERTNI
ncbi:alpha/beta hydrolase [Salinibacillus aidingensis]|uniref:Alpha/beta hydrolase n=1 Tax=Salinibacillus aidingensis TaxID=237684 RepID=A0ABN1B1X8_9BACI